jgi:hypothetical protein
MISSWGNAATRSSFGIAIAIVIAVALAACVSTKPAVETVGASNASNARAQTEAPRAWAYESLDSRPVTAEGTRGKPTVLAFVTTDNLASQAQVSFLVAMAKNDHDRVNYALVAMHTRKDREIVELYRTTLAVTFPVALVDDASISGGGPFPVEAVPTVVVLDREGRLVWRTTGLARPADIRPHLNAR